MSASRRVNPSPQELVLDFGAAISGLGIRLRRGDNPPHYKNCIQREVGV